MVLRPSEGNQVTTAHINAIGTAVPRHDIHARFIGLADRLLEGDARRRIFRRMAGLAGIEHRWSFLEQVDDAHFGAGDRAGFYRLGSDRTSVVEGEGV